MKMLKKYWKFGLISSMLGCIIFILISLLNDDDITVYGIITSFIASFFVYVVIVVGIATHISESKNNESKKS